MSLQRSHLQLPARGKDAQRDWKIKAPGILGQVRGREVDGDAPRWKLEPRVIERGAHAVLGFAHLGIGQADDIECRQPRPEVNLDRHFGRGNSCERATRDDG